MAYIIFVNPGILSAAGVPFAGAATATALGAALMCVCMGLIANRPFALASGMGLNAVVTFSLIGFQQANVPWQVGMSVIFVEGLIILAAGAHRPARGGHERHPARPEARDRRRHRPVHHDHRPQRGRVHPSRTPITLVGLGDFTQTYVWVTVIGLLAILMFMALKVKGDILWGILVATVAALLLGVTKLPTAVVGAPDFSTFFAPFQQVERQHGDHADLHARRCCSRSSRSC